MMRGCIHLVLAGTVADPALRESIEDDLLAEYGERVTAAGRYAAAGWAFRQLLVSFPDFAGLGVTGARPCRPLASASAFYGILLLIVGTGAGLSEIALRGGTLDGSRAADGVSLLGTLALTGLAGYLLAALASRAPLAAALGLGLVCAAIAVGAVALGDPRGAVWYLAVFGLLAPMVSLAGGLVRVRQRLASFTH